MRSSRICCRLARGRRGTSAGRYYAVVEESLISPGMGRGRKKQGLRSQAIVSLFAQLPKMWAVKINSRIWRKDIAVVFAREGAKGAIAELNQKAADAMAREIDSSESAPSAWRWMS